MSTSAQIRQALADNPLTMSELLKAIGQPPAAEKKIRDLLYSLKQQGDIKRVTVKGEFVYGLAKENRAAGGGVKKKRRSAKRKAKPRASAPGGGASAPADNSLYLRHARTTFALLRSVLDLDGADSQLVHAFAAHDEALQLLVGAHEG